MNQFRSNEIETFLRAVDRHLTDSIEIRIIGGAAAVLSFGLQSATMDIDLKSITAPDFDTTTSTTRFEGACEAARKETGLDIPVASVGIWDAPYAFESRFTPAPLRGLKKLSILVPEKHDWALMKIVRLDAKDIAHIKEAHGLAGFDRQLFLQRFITEMTHVSPSKRLGRYFLTMMEELFGAEVAGRMEMEIRKRPEWKSM